jgi:hypothetical protein
VGHIPPEQSLCQPRAAVRGLSGRLTTLSKIMAGHAFVDESKATQYVFAVTSVDSSRVNAVRKTLKALLLPRQSRINFRDEATAERSGSSTSS